MTAYQFSQPWLSQLNGEKEMNALEWAHLRDYLKGVDNGTISLFNPNFINFQINGASFSLPVSVANGGTNSTTALANGFLMVSSGGKIVEIAADSSANSKKVTSLANGTVTADAINFSQYQTTTHNILDNGGFEIWQRGTSFSAPADATYGSDRWQFNTDEAANVTVTKEVTTIDTGLASMKVVTTSSGASKKWFVSETIENYADYRGKTLTLSVRVNANVASAVKIVIADSTSETASSYHTGGSAWETLTVSRAIGSATTSLRIYIGMRDAGDKKNGTYYWDSAMLIIGSEAVTFVPTNPEVDFDRCQRYFQVIGGVTGIYHAVGLSFATTDAGFILFLPVTMRAAPTLTVNNATNWRATNGVGTQIAATALAILTATTPSSLSLDLTVTAGLTTGQASLLATANANATLYLSADL